MNRKIKVLYPAAERAAYFLTPSTGLVPKYIYDAVQSYQNDRLIIGGESQWNGMSTEEMMEWSKSRIGEMIHAEKEDIFFADNSSRLLNLFCQNILLSPIEYALISDHTFISGKFAWQLRETGGTTVKYFRFQDGMDVLHSIAGMIDENTRVLCIDYVNSASGYRYDMGAIGTLCKEHNIWLCVDAVQAMGALDIDVQKMGIDFLVTNNYKWMNGFCGLGIAYISKELREVIAVEGAGWMTDQDRFNTKKSHLEIREDAGRYEMGYPGVSAIYAAGLYAEKYLEYGAQNVEAYLMGLSDYLKKRIDQTPKIDFKYNFKKENLSQIHVLCVDTMKENFIKELEKDGVMAEGEFNPSTNTYEIRIGLHIYNDVQDIDHLIDAMERSL